MQLKDLSGASNALNELKEAKEELEKAWSTFKGMNLWDCSEDEYLGSIRKAST
jgi:hypothetical protein